MTNIELRELLSNYPDDSEVLIDVDSQVESVYLDSSSNSVTVVSKSEGFIGMGYCPECGR